LRYGKEGGHILLPIFTKNALLAGTFIVAAKLSYREKGLLSRYRTDVQKTEPVCVRHVGVNVLAQQWAK
jgi:hypothetical protein